MSTNAIQQAYKLLLQVHKKNEKTRDHEFICSLFPGQHVFQHGKDTVVVVPQDRMFLTIENCTGLTSNVSDDDDDDDDDEGYVKVLIGSLDHDNWVKTCSSTPYSMIVSIKDVAECISHLDYVLRASGRVPSRMTLYGRTSDPENTLKSVKEYLQNDWVDNLILVNHYDYSIAENQVVDEIREWIRENDKTPQEIETIIDEPETDESRACPICYANQKKMAFLPCGHCSCYGCFEQVVKKPNILRECPVCRASISTKRQRVYL